MAVNEYRIGTDVAFKDQLFSFYVKTWMVIEKLNIGVGKS